ncbi:hypothetical protein PG985_003547 [Apiospora marii]|uniref:uncharacterized protein n=1 Tax=Apiospora marii TaxID=335849 RepID=UPI00312D5474
MAGGEGMRFGFGMLSEPPMALEANHLLKGSHHLLPSAIEQPPGEGNSSYPRLYSITPQSMGTLERSGTESGPHRVLISLSCTTGVLGNVISLITGTGLDVSTKGYTK